MVNYLPLNDSLAMCFHKNQMILFNFSTLEVINLKESKTYDNNNPENDYYSQYPCIVNGVIYVVSERSVFTFDFKDF